MSRKPKDKQDSEKLFVSRLQREISVITESCVASADDSVHLKLNVFVLWDGAFPHYNHIFIMIIISYNKHKWCWDNTRL